jgi:hypothetical protein
LEPQREECPKLTFTAIYLKKSKSIHSQTTLARCISVIVEFMSGAQEP